MKRKKTITAADEDVTIRVIVKVESKSHGLTRHETNLLLDKIVDETMMTIKAMPYIGTAIHEMKIT